MNRINKMSKSNNSTGGGIGFLGILTIVFIVLKLTNYIDWSWWWVLSPMWIPVLILLLVLIIIAVLKQLTHPRKQMEQMQTRKTGFAARIESLQKQQELMKQNKKK